MRDSSMRSRCSRSCSRRGGVLNGEAEEDAACELGGPQLITVLESESVFVVILVPTSNPPADDHECTRWLGMGMIGTGVATSMVCGALFCLYGTSDTVGPSVGIGGGLVPPVEVSTLLGSYVLVWYPSCDKTEFWVETPPVTGIGAAVPPMVAMPSCVPNTSVVVGSTALLGCLCLQLYHKRRPMSRSAVTPPAVPPPMGARLLWELPEPVRDGDVVSVG
ncbi:hypothetical protein B0H17DRAFT_1101908 [Mycena rosella]|uniref:Uncharacterized protein n=1 Tax=Mycena rosella TaxID=1033263 RepID=A0AAD7G3M1_MYCRO|nr:hypothetical protein B0H17DRAFT_1101908 [Mycena rosella]